MINFITYFIKYLIAFFLIYIWVYLSIFFHEMGHFIFAKIAGMSPYLVKIGVGKKLFKIRIFNALFEFYCVPYGGMTYAEFFSLKWIKLKLIFFLFGGSFVNFILLVTAINIAKVTENVLLIVPIYVEFIILSFNLITLRVKVNGIDHPNDGKQIILAIFTNYKKIFDNVFEEYKKALLRYESNENKLAKNFLSNDIRILQRFIRAEEQLEQGYVTEAIRRFLEILDFERISDLEKAFILDHLACIVTINGYKKYLNDADKWSQEALRLASYSKTLKGTRGAILIELGRYDEGKQWLLPLTEPDNEELDIAISSCYIAKAEYFLGNIDRANDWLVNAQKIDNIYANTVLKRIQQEINYSL